MSFASGDVYVDFEEDKFHGNGVITRYGDRCV